MDGEKGVGIALLDREKHSGLPKENIAGGYAQNCAIGQAQPEVAVRIQAFRHTPLGLVGQARLAGLAQAIGAVRPGFCDRRKASFHPEFSPEFKAFDQYVQRIKRQRRRTVQQLGEGHGWPFCIVRSLGEIDPHADGQPEGPVITGADSTRIPAAFRPPTIRSLGHFSWPAPFPR